MNSIFALALAVYAVISAQPVYHEDRDEPDRDLRLWYASAAVAEASEGQPWRAARLIVLGEAESRWAEFVAERCHLERVRCDKGLSLTYWQQKRRACPEAHTSVHGSYRQVLAGARCADRQLRVSRDRLQEAFCRLGASGSLCDYGAVRAARVPRIEWRLSSRKPSGVEALADNADR